MQCTDDVCQSAQGVNENRIQLNNGGNESSRPPYHIQRFTGVVGQQSQFLCSGRATGFTSETSVSNSYVETHDRDVETDGEINGLTNRHSMRLQSPHVRTENTDDLHLQAKVQHERKRKLLFTQKIEGEPDAESRPAKFRAYKNIDIRIKSFVGFVTLCLYPPFMFAKAGFFYKGFADIVACFHCGLTHKTFQQDDDPIIIHIKLKPQCPYITGLRNEGILSCKDLMEDSLETGIVSFDESVSGYSKYRI